MEKQKKWPILLILFVIGLTLYNILPTLIYYAKPLHKPIGKSESSLIGKELIKRVNSLEQGSQSWIQSYAKHLGLKLSSLSLDPQNPQLIEVTFKKGADAAKFKKHIAKAGSLIPFLPAQLTPIEGLSEDPLKVSIERKIGTHLDESYLSFTPKRDQGLISSEYKEVQSDRIHALVQSLTAQNPWASSLRLIKSAGAEMLSSDVLRVATHLMQLEKDFTDTSPLCKRIFKAYTEGFGKDEAFTLLATHFEQEKGSVQKHLQSLKEKQADKNGLISSEKENEIQVLQKNLEILESALAIVKRNKKIFSQGLPYYQNTSFENRIDLQGHHPFIQSLEIQWDQDTVAFTLYSDMGGEKSQKMLFNETARLAQVTGEEILAGPSGDITAHLNRLDQVQGLLSLNLEKLSSELEQRLLNNLSLWNPALMDLKSEYYPVVDFKTYQGLDKLNRQFGLVVINPLVEKIDSPFFRTDSLYVIAKGFEPLLQKYGALPNSPEAAEFQEDFSKLHALLMAHGFKTAYPGSAFSQEWKSDYIFECPHFALDLLKGTRENFKVFGKRALLEVSDVQERITTLNKIDQGIHDELLKWRDDFKAAQVDLNPNALLEIAPPTQNPFLSNLMLNIKEYFRGDSRKILKWGLDLSGGKTVIIGLKDANGQPVTNHDELTEALNELTRRVNKMGVSEVEIRIQGPHIVLDFPSSKGISASELIKASSMTFHVVNEKFSLQNPELAPLVNAFLQEVWNEAVVTHKTDMESLNEIAYTHLGGLDNGSFQPRSTLAKQLYEKGLRLAFKNQKRSAQVNESLSMIATYGTEEESYRGASHPLLVVFYNYALEGVHLENIHVAYDVSKGNVLNFSVKKSYTTKSGEKLNPAESLHEWSSLYCQENITGTPKEKVSRGHGWRLAALLNQRVIADPVLNSALSDNVQVQGGFTQHQINRLAQDLKAGSLSFTPQILSEENISPELGLKERTKSIFATILAVVLVFSIMCGYYRFAGLIASIAVIFNLLILWGVLQNLSATLTLATIAGIILTVGMAVDANVLVFERVREELEAGSRLSLALKAGYQKAFNAILDSNVTTILAAVILLNFDAGPIKGFALSLMIGIASSMFTALFMTRTFFERWIQKNPNRKLSMANWIKAKKHDFLKKAPLFCGASLSLMVIASVLLFTQKQSFLGIDFTGGYTCNLELQEKEGVDYNNALTAALLSQGLESQDFQVRTLNKPNMLRLQLGMSLTEEGKPFNTLPEEERVSWILKTAQEKGLEIANPSLTEKSWSAMSGQLSHTMRNNALLGLLLSMVFILAYLSFRFEWKYALASILTLVHDVAITLAFMAILQYFKVPVKLNMQVVAAMLTIIGYSLNDTIIVFDRIREESRMKRGALTPELINYSLRTTLNRTTMTSFTTFIVLVALLAFGGSKIFDFSLVMSLGVVLGTLSSLYLSPLLLVLLEKRETRSLQKSIA